MKLVLARGLSPSYGVDMEGSWWDSHGLVARVGMGVGAVAATLLVVALGVGLILVGPELWPCWDFETVTNDEPGEEPPEISESDAERFAEAGCTTAEGTWIVVPLVFLGIAVVAVGAFVVPYWVMKRAQRPRRPSG